MHELGQILLRAWWLVEFTSPAVNSVLGIIIVGYILPKLLSTKSNYNYKERVGISIIAAGVIMATPALWMPNTPFDGWSFNVARFGMVYFIITGGLRRDRHAKRNAEANRYALEWLDRRRREE
jgi:hypothetical protein